jgi:hypothetical protein
LRQALETLLKPPDDLLHASRDREECPATLLHASRDREE